MLGISTVLSGGSAPVALSLPATVPADGQPARHSGHARTCPELGVYAFSPGVVGRSALPSGVASASHCWQEACNEPRSHRSDLSVSTRPAARSPHSNVLTLAGLTEPSLIRLGRTYGSTKLEQATPLPGDDIIDHPAVVTNHAITICASPDRVWPG